MVLGPPSIKFGAASNAATAEVAPSRDNTLDWVFIVTMLSEWIGKDCCVD